MHREKRSITRSSMSARRRKTTGSAKLRISSARPFRDAAWSTPRTGVRINGATASVAKKFAACCPASNRNGTLAKVHKSCLKPIARLDSRSKISNVAATLAWLKFNDCWTPNNWMLLFDGGFLIRQSKIRGRNELLKLGCARKKRNLSNEIHGKKIAGRVRNRYRAAGRFPWVLCAHVLPARVRGAWIESNYRPGQHCV